MSEDLFPRIRDHSLLRDRHRLRRRWRALRRPAGAADAEALAALAADVDTSAAAVAARRARLPRPAFDDALPVVRRLDDIAAALDRHQVVVVCGETGSGKTTQLPKLCLQLGYGARGLIGHTQPRRIAARAVAARIADELGEPLGGAVGYKVRFSDQVGPDALIKLMTDGMLLAETQRERFLDSYEVIIVDEAHERSLNIDFLLGYLRRLLPQRPELRLIITSATIDPERFSRHFDDAPIIDVSGRGYPVELRYRPLGKNDGDGGGDDDAERDLQQAIVDAVDELGGAAERRGDMLIFLTGEREIRDTAETLRRQKLDNTEILPLYARLSASEQQRVFRPSSRRRIVLATNVAETSLTVPGIRYVIDPGQARVSRYSHRAKVQRLPIERISQASAAQRAGRCGRTAPGICIRLYSEDDFDSRPAFTDPEILRTNLAAVILQMAALRLGAIEDFPFLDAPDRRQISDGFTLLYELQAVDQRQRITALGRELARLPLDPRLGRMLLAAADENCTAELLVIVSALTVQDPRERPLDKRQAADEKHRDYRDPRSDFIGLLKLWDRVSGWAGELSRSQLRGRCREQFLSYVRLREWRELAQQLRAQLGAAPINAGAPLAERADYAAVHRSLLTGLLSQVGQKRPDGPGFRGARGRQFHVFPGSALFKKPPPWLAAAELVETKRLYARVCAAIEPRWLERLAAHLSRRSYSAPRWEARAGQVAADEQVVLYGLTLVSGRRVNYGPIDPDDAHEIFLRALADDEVRSRGDFLRHNRERVAALAALEDRTRRRDLLAGDDAAVAFYRARVPASVYSLPAFEKWRKRAEGETPGLLYFRDQDLLARAVPDDVRARFPDTLVDGALTLPLSYRFDPSADDDGVTLTVPLAALNQLDARRLDWLVPGLLAERVEALIKNLPKALRKQLVPVPDTVARVLPRLHAARGSLRAALSTELQALSGVAVDETLWDDAALPDYLRMRVRVLAAHGGELASGRDLDALRRRLGACAAASFDALPTQEYERERLKDWDFGPLADTVEFERNGVRLRGYPALVADEDGGVALRLLDSPARAEREHRDGLRRLIALRARDKFNYLKRHLPDLQTLSLHYVAIGNQRQLLDELRCAVTDQAFLADGLPRDRAQFQRALERGRATLLEVADAVAVQVGEILARHHAIRQRLSDPRLARANGAGAVDDIREQLAALVYPGFIAATPPERLAHLPRYLRAIERRLDKLANAVDKDAQRMQPIREFQQRYRERLQAHRQRGIDDPALEHFRWLIEELRVSQFAQELKTAQPVSIKRLQTSWQEIR